MATMVSEIYDAFLDAGASQEKARKAAEVLAHVEAQPARVEAGLRTDIADVKREVVELRGELSRDVSALRSEANLVRWMLGTVLAMNVAVLAKLLFLPA